MMHRYFFVFLVFLSLPSFCQDQSDTLNGCNPSKYIGVSIGGFYGLPLERMSSSGYPSSWGFDGGMSLYLTPPEEKLHFDIGFDFAVGFTKKSSIDIDLDGLGEQGVYKLGNEHKSVGLFARFSVEKSERLRFYVSMKTGLRSFETVEKIKQKRPFNADFDVTTSQYIDSRTIGYLGGTIGVMYDLGDNLFVDFGASVNTGDGFEFIETTSLNNGINGPLYEWNSTEASDLLFFHLGFHVILPCGKGCGSEPDRIYDSSPSPSNVPVESNPLKIKKKTPPTRVY